MSIRSFVDDNRLDDLAAENFASRSNFRRKNFCRVELIEVIRLTENISDALEKNYSNFVVDGRIGDSTPKTLALPVANLSACLLDTNRTVPTAQYKIFRLVEDLGLRYLEIGTNHPSGAKFEGDYRSFRVEYGGDEKIVSLSTSDYGGDRTIICVDVDKENYVNLSRRNIREVIINRRAHA